MSGWSGWMVVVLAGGCGKPAPQDRPNPEETGETGVLHTGTPPSPTGATGDTGSTATGHTADTGAPTVPASDPFLAGDPATIVAQLTLSMDDFGPPPTDWSFTGYTFDAGRFRWIGKVVVPATGLDTCEVRDGDPEIETSPANAGAIDLFSAAGPLLTTSPALGFYSGLEQLADLDPRGLEWQIVAEGDAVPSFDLPAAITFPTGTLTVLAPAAEGEVPRSAPLTFTWTGDPAERVEIRLTSGVDQIRCMVTDDGSFELAAGTLSMLPLGRISSTVSRVNLEGHTVDGVEWVEVRAVQAVHGGFTLAP